MKEEYNCPICKQGFSNLTVLKTHLMSHPETMKVIEKEFNIKLEKADLEGEIRELKERLDFLEGKHGKPREEFVLQDAKERWYKAVDSLGKLQSQDPIMRPPKPPEPMEYERPSILKEKWSEFNLITKTLMIVIIFLIASYFYYSYSSAHINYTGWYSWITSFLP